MSLRLLAVASVAVLLTSPRAGAQDTSFVRALRSNASTFSIQNGRLEGPARAAFARLASENDFLLVGEDHGFRELPEFVAALFDVARPVGYEHLGVEVGPITARRLDTMMRRPSALRDLDAFLGRYTPYTVPFFFWREEAGMLERVVKSVPARDDAVWGLDQEFIMSPTYMLERLTEIAPTASARALARHFAEASARGDKSMLTTGNPGAVWMVSAADSDVASLRLAFAASSRSEVGNIVDELAASRDIYRLFNSGAGHESNQIRDDLMKRHFVDAYRAAQARGEKRPKAVVKLGANHIFRGPSITDTYEMGSFIPEFAIANGVRSFGMLVVVKRGTTNAYRPFGSKEADKTQPYDVLVSEEYKVFDLKSVLESTPVDAWSFIDLRPVRAAALDGKLKGLSANARRLLLSFDGVVTVPEGHASVYFR
ncbi:MAG TPA: hypothetical protein VGO33_01425 [Gemmatimonadaceae bacterium]|jgi:hypothetical protein|nr:hypothetical protein [Gemmatimonadaceae bacterium]